MLPYLPGKTASKFIAVTIAEILLDCAVYTTPAVTIVEMMDALLTTADHCLNNAMALNELIAKSNIHTQLGSKLVKCVVGGVEIEKNGETVKLDCDTLVYAVGFRSEHTLAEQLEGNVKQLHVIGNYDKPGKIVDATNGAYHTIRLLEHLD